MDDNMKFISNLIPLGDALAKIDENQKIMDTILKLEGKYNGKNYYSI